MFNIQKHLRHAVLAVGLAAASLTASAGVLPTYHIGIADTATADIAAIDFLLTTLGGTVPVTATLSHFTGAPLDEGDIYGSVTPTADGFKFSNAESFNYLITGVNGPFAFDLNFSEDFLGAGNPADGSLLSIALFDSNGMIIGNQDGSLNFSLSTTGVVTISNSSLVSVKEIAAAAVPEPADWLLMLTGLVCVVGMTRLNGRTSARRLAAA